MTSDRDFLLAPISAMMKEEVSLVRNEHPDLTDMETKVLATLRVYKAVTGLCPTRVKLRSMVASMEMFDETDDLRKLQYWHPETGYEARAEQAILSLKAKGLLEVTDA